jgi:hypothetical protein
MIVAVQSAAVVAVIAVAVIALAVSASVVASPNALVAEPIHMKRWQRFWVWH